MLGRDLGIEVIAEGVETADQLDALTREGCRCFQGYFFGRPAPLSDALHGALKALLALPAQARHVIAPPPADDAETRPVRNAAATWG
ncbi:EAL domain-containing protein, partial [Mycobacterium tuberculosis]|nr:EAL domain-containing protein [Mycobacterium tuberculosis]